MNRRLFSPLLIVGIIAIPGLVSAETPNAATIVERAISAAELESSIAEHDMIRSAIRQEETTSDGTAKSTDMTAIIYGSRLDSIRMELSQGATIVLDNSKGWALIRGELDTRAQTPRMAAGTIRQTIFPLMLPYSLRMPGVQLGMVTEGNFDGTPAWVVEITFDPNFFIAPSMLTKWSVFISKKDNVTLGAEFLPAAEFRSVRDEGIRYRILKRQNVDGLSLPAQVLLDGIDVNGTETGHVRVTKVESTTAGPLDLSLFIHPKERERLDAAEID